MKQETPPPGSEVARLIEEIDLQTGALIQGLSGFAEGSSRHEIIHARWGAIIGRYQGLLEQANQTNPS